MVFAFFNLGTPELIVIALLALLLFGRRLPSVMRNLGKGITEFKKGLHDEEGDDLDGNGHKALPDSVTEDDEKPLEDDDLAG